MSKTLEELVVTIRADLDKYKKDVSNLTKPVDDANNSFVSSVTKVGEKLTGVFGAYSLAAIGAAIAANELVDTMVHWVELAKVQNKAEQILESQLKATGNAAGLTAQEIKNLASARQEITNFGDEVTIQAASILTSFTNIREDAFKETIAVAQDINTVMGGTLNGTVTQLGKALNAPTQNLGALSRAGIQFSDQQKEVIKWLEETNRLEEAQSVILDELKHQYEGAAEAAASPAKQLSNMWGDFKETLGQILLPAIGDVIAAVKEMVASFVPTQGGEGPKAFGEAIRQLMSPVTLLIKSLTWVIKIVLQVKDTLVGFFQGLNDRGMSGVHHLVKAIQVLWEWLVKLGKLIGGAISTQINRLVALFEGIVEITFLVGDAFRNAAMAVLRFIDNIVGLTDFIKLMGLIFSVIMEKISSGLAAARDWFIKILKTMTKVPGVGKVVTAMLAELEGQTKKNVEAEKDHKQSLADLDVEMKKAKAAEEALAKEKERAQKISEKINQKALAIKTMMMSAEAAELYKFQLEGANAAEVQHYSTLLNQEIANNRILEQRKEAIKLAEEYRKAREEEMKAAREAIAAETKVFTDHRDGLQIEIDLWGVVGRERAIALAQMNGMTDARVKELKTLDEVLSKMEKQKALWNQYKAVVESLKTPQQKFNDEVAKLIEIRHLLGEDNFYKALDKLRNEFEEPFVVDLRIKGRDAVVAGSAEAIERLREFRMTLEKPLGELKGAEAAAKSNIKLPAAVKNSEPIVSAKEKFAEKHNINIDTFNKTLDASDEAIHKLMAQTANGINKLVSLEERKEGIPADLDS